MRKKTLPIYLKVYQEIRKEISSGKYPPGSTLPSETKLASAYSISRATVRKALSVLEDDGLITIRQGKGASVLSGKEEQEIDYGYSTLGHMDSVVSLRVKDGTADPVMMADPEIDLIKAPDEVAQKLSLGTGEMVYRVQRLKSQGKRIVSYALSYVPEVLAPGLDGCQVIGLFDFLKSHYQMRIDRVDNVINARTPDFIISEMLRLDKNVPVFVSTRVAYVEGKPVVLTETYLAADLAEYVISSKVRNL